MTTHHPRTTIVSTALANASATLGDDEIDALLDVHLSATQAAIRSRDWLLDFDEYREADL